MLKVIQEVKSKMRVSMVAASPLLLGILLILANVAIWWLGPSLQWFGYHPLFTITHRVLASCVLILIAALVWGGAQKRKLIKIESEQAHRELLVQDPDLAVIERQGQELDLIVKYMKDSIGTRQALYSQPWYLLMGMEGAGKSSFVQRSGQSFTFSSSLRSSGFKSENTHSFDWWIGDEAVLIDPNGALLCHDSSRDPREVSKLRRQWLHFIEWLENTRSRRPLNGIVLTIDIAKISTSDESELQIQAECIRARLKELMDTIESRLPVYVVLTKFDLLLGFEAFFRNYSSSEKEELLGFVFSLASSNNTDFWLGEFASEFSKLVSKLNATLPQIAPERSSEERQAIYAFTRQVAGLKNRLVRFLEVMLQSDKFSTAALVRGVYFTSVYQEGIPCNVFCDAISQRYGLTKSVKSAQSTKTSDVFFAKKLLSHVVFPESGLASDNAKVVKRKKRLMRLSVFTCSFATMLLVISWHEHYKDNVERSDNVLEKVSQYQKQSGDKGEAKTYQDILEELNLIREATLEFGVFRDKSKYVSDMGLYQGHEIGPKVEQTYLRLLKSAFLPLLMNDVIVKLNDAQSNEEKLSVLRVYRMLTDESGRQKTVVMDYLSRLWQRSYPEQREIQEALLGHLDYAMQHVDLVGDRRLGDQVAIKALAPFDKVITQTQLILGEMPNEERVYRNMRLSAQSVLGAPVNVRQFIGPTFDLVFQERHHSDERLFIPRFLTKEGFEKYFIPQVNSVSTLALTDSWVLSQSETADFSVADKQVLQEKIRAQYIADYTNAWREAINALDIHSFTDLNDAVLVLSSLVGSSEPLQRLLRAFADNTQIYSLLPEDQAAQSALLSSAPYKMSKAIETPFSRINSLSDASRNGDNNLNQVLAIIVELQSYLTSIQESPDVGAAALEATKARVSLRNTDPIYTLKRVSRGLPAPVDAFVNKLADESWRVVKQEAIRYLDIRWNRDVYEVFQTQFANRYPFSKKANKDVAIRDFELFFSPGGTLDSFYNTQLKWFLDEISEKSTEGNTIIRQDVLEQLEQAKYIREAFFNRKGVLDVSFTLEPRRLSSNKRRSVLYVDGQFLTYSHGSRESVEMIWPNTLREGAISKVTLVPNQANVSPRSIENHGPWALFRLLDRSKVTSISSTAIDYQFDIDAGDMTYRLHSKTSINPFLQNPLSVFTLSNSLY